MDDIPEETRYYPFLNQSSLSFSLAEAAETITAERGRPLGAEEVEWVRGYLGLHHPHVTAFYPRILAHQQKKGRS